MLLQPEVKLAPETAGYRELNGEADLILDLKPKSGEQNEAMLELTSRLVDDEDYFELLVRIVKDC